MRLGVPLLSMDEMGEFCRIAKEKDRSVVEYPIEDTFFGLDLDRKSLHILESIDTSPLLAKECLERRFKG